jgi:glycerophosphoryl diester phosphodiesterase
MVTLVTPMWMRGVLPVMLLRLSLARGFGVLEISGVDGRMTHFEIVAHRGIPIEAPENSMASFQKAIELGADAVELDVRLTADKIPVVYHYYYLQENTSASGAIFDFTLEQLRDVKVFCKNNPEVNDGRISTLAEILETLRGKIGVEIEIKGPEPEAPEIIGGVLNQFKNHWNTFEITSTEPALLLAIQKFCPGIIVDLLYPRSESWMKSDVVQYEAIHYSRLAHARAVHLHPGQLCDEVVNALHHQNIEIHAWDVNDEQSLQTVVGYGIPRICTDYFKQALAFRDKMS